MAVTIDDIRLEEKLEGLPKNPGVYQYKNAAGKVIYVGKAKNLKNRVRSYFQNYRRGAGDAKLRALVEKIADVELILTDSDVEALILENTLIKKLKPRYNVNLRDDKTYPWVCITNEPYPKVFPTRRKRHDGSKYFGPYTDGTMLHYVLRTLRDIFPLRTCEYAIDADFIARKRARVCLEYHIKRCEGPCEGLVSQESYAAMIKKVRQFLAGRTRDLEKALREEMHRHAEEMRFEEAAKVRDQITILAEYSNKQKVLSEEHTDRDIFATSADDDDACGVVFKVRDGKLVGKQQFFFTGTEGKNEQEILEALLERFYSTTDYIPEEIFLPVELEDTETVEKWLARRSRELSNDEDAGAMKPPKLIVPKIGDKVKLVAMAATNAKFLLGEIKIQKLKQSDFTPHAVKALQRDLHLSKLPKHIECFDNSHLQGTEYVSSMVYFENGKPKKNEYRKYKLRTIEGNDDFAAMREVVMRRYGRLLDENAELPDLIIIDGGKGQLSSAYEVLSGLGLKDIPVIGLAKRLEEVFTVGSSESILLPRTSSSLKLLQHIRDEAHNFAITYHRVLREKRTIRTELMQIPGIGKKTAMKLLEVFGSVDGVRHTSEPELVSAVGLKATKQIIQYFKEQEAIARAHSDHDSN
ncbi:MAG: excinuclease ABC subunit C [Bacteroidetes bacterium]|nr:excinuclease ABC subunit C [Bacteroidota bacterium]